MIPTTRALLSCVLLLCTLREAVLSRSGRCSGNLCFFENLGDFQVSERECKALSGDLFRFKPEDDMKALTSLLSGLVGKYWVHRAENCSAVSVEKGRAVAESREPCSNKVNGFLCKLSVGCSRLQTPRGAEVTYTTHTGFDVTDSETFPPGVTAETKKAGGKYPDSRHLCGSDSWLQAPWGCEVMGGGCEHNCNGTPATCTCPEGYIIHANNINCTADPCANCKHRCQKEGDSYVCVCEKGYRLAKDGKSCVDVNECEEDNPCTGEGEECINTQGGYSCECRYDFVEEDGKCINISICDKCEHMDCRKDNGVYKCFCKKGYRVTDKDPTKCEIDCNERDCPATCIQNTDPNRKDLDHCLCPEGYVRDTRDNTTICTDINECDSQQMCDHKCENTFGGYRCLCNEGFTLEGVDRCVKEQDEDDGSGSSAPFIPPDSTPASTPASSQPAALPSYIKTGSVLGISLFMVVCVALLYFVARSVSKHCKALNIYSFKHPDIDIFYLQQVTTETYKRLSFDKQIRNDSQRL